MAAIRNDSTNATSAASKHGALAYLESVGEDLAPEHGVPFPKLARTKPGEPVIFAFILFRSRAHRDRVNANVMKDPALHQGPEEMPFEMKRMTYGGFTVLVDL